MFSNDSLSYTLESPRTVETVPEPLSGDEVLQKVVCGRIDAIVERVQRYLHRTDLERLYGDSPYESNDAVWDDLVHVLEQARSVALPQNHHKRVKLGMWISRAHTGFRYPKSKLDIFKDHEEEDSIAKIQ